MSEPTDLATPIHAPRMVERRLTLALYITAVFLYWVALYLYMPTLPTYAEAKSGSMAVVGVVLSMYGLWQAVIRFPLGFAADCLGCRKPFILFGFGLAGLGAWVMGSASGVNGLIVGRAITGLAAGTWVPLVVAFSSLFPPREAIRASVILTLVGSIGRMIATGATGALNDLGGYTLAFYLAAAAAILAILFVLPTREMRRPPQRPSTKVIGNLLARRDVLLPSLLSALSQYANWATTFGFVPILAKQLGATDMTQSALVSLNVGVVLVGNLAATTIVKRLGARELVYASFGLLSLGVAGAAIAPSLLLLFVAQFCIGFSQGIGYPVLMGMSIEHVADVERTTAMGLHQAIYAVGMFGGPWLSGFIAEGVGIRAMFGFTAGICLALGLYATRWLGQPRTH